MPNLEKIINLIKRTGDNCIVLDHEGNPAYVLMSLEDYESIVSAKSEVATLSEDELLNKINRDIATWKANQETDDSNNWSVLEDAVEEVKKPLFRSSYEEKSLNEANTEEVAEKDENSQEKYYFEPID